MRLDRVIQKAPRSGELNWKPTSIEIFGNQPVLGEDRSRERVRRGRKEREEREKEAEEEGEGERERERNSDEEEQILISEASTRSGGEVRKKLRMPWQSGFFAFCCYTSLALVKVLFDLCGVNVLRSKRKYLYPSDHFGLLSEFEISARL